MTYFSCSITGQNPLSHPELPLGHCSFIPKRVASQEPAAPLAHFELTSNKTPTDFSKTNILIWEHQHCSFQSKMLKQNMSAFQHVILKNAKIPAVSLEWKLWFTLSLSIGKENQCVNDTEKDLLSKPREGMLKSFAVQGLHWWRTNLEGSIRETKWLCTMPHDKIMGAVQVFIVSGTYMPPLHSPLNICLRWMIMNDQPKNDATSLPHPPKSDSRAMEQGNFDLDCSTEHSNPYSCSIVIF